MGSISSLTVNWAHEKQHRSWYKDETTSTNTIAKDEFESIEDFKIYVTNAQTEGRGRGQNVWENTKEKNSLLSTWAFKSNHPAQHFLPALVGLATFSACRSIWQGLKWSLKAPNDIFIDDKKVAGILTEIVQQGDQYLVLIGLGFNIFSRPENVETSSYLVNHLGEFKSFNEEQWSSFLDQLLTNLQTSIQNAQQLKISDQDRELLLEAINANPWKKEIYLDVTDQGDLVTENETMSWRDL